MLNGWRYSQLKHFIETLPQPIRSSENLLPLEQLCTATGKKRGISRIYKILMGMKVLEMPPFIGKWEAELGTRVNDLEVRKILRMVRTMSVDSNTIEINYKCLARWYITPDKAHKCQSKTSQL